MVRTARTRAPSNYANRSRISNLSFNHTARICKKRPNLNRMHSTITKKTIKNAYVSSHLNNRTATRVGVPNSVCLTLSPDALLKVLVKLLLGKVSMRWSCQNYIAAMKLCHGARPSSYRQIYYFT
jgi:hypothetical protein